MFVLYVLHETLWNFISTVMRLDYHSRIGNIWNQSEKVHRNYKIFIEKMIIIALSRNLIKK